MEPVYSQHLRHAHHSGLIIGTVIGSCATTLLIAIAFVAASPQTAFRPWQVVSAMHSEPSNTTASDAAQTAVPAEAGIGMSQISNISDTSATAGVAGQSAPQIFRHYDRGGTQGQP